MVKKFGGKRNGVGGGGGGGPVVNGVASSLQWSFLFTAAL